MKTALPQNKEEEIGVYNLVRSMHGLDGGLGGRLERVCKK